jgi:hypothetical protein
MPPLQRRTIHCCTLCFESTLTCDQLRMYAQVKRNDISSELNMVNDSRKKKVVEVMSGDTPVTSFSDEGVPVGNLRSNFTVFREIMKVLISFGQVLSSFAYV